MKTHPNRKSVDNEDIAQLYKSTRSLQKVSQLVRLSVSTVHRRLKESGVFTDRRTYLIDETLFQVLDAEWKAYFLGLLFADGCVSSNYAILLNLHEKDRAILEQLNTHVYQNQKPLTYSRAVVYKGKDGLPRNNAAQYKLIICSKRICENLSKWGCSARKSLSLLMPMDIPKDMMSHFIRGYFDGDGGVSDHTWCIVSSKAFCLSLSEYLRSLGLHAVCSDYRKVARLRCWRRADVKFLYEYLYKDATIFLERKRAAVYEASRGTPRI